jgi:hypothetical protein
MTQELNLCARPSHRKVVHPRIADEEDNLQIWTLTAIVFNLVAESGHAVVVRLGVW